MGQTGARRDPSLIAFFRVDLDGMKGDGGSSFSKCSGLKNETEVFEYREGGENELVHKLLGPTRASNIVLTQGHISDPALINWRNEVAYADGKPVKRRNGSIVALAADGTEVDRWDFVGAHPISWRVNDFDRESNDILTEVLELAVQKITHSR